LPDYAKANLCGAFARRPEYFRFADGRLRVRTRVDGRHVVEHVCLAQAIQRTTNPKNRKFVLYGAAGRYVDEIFVRGDGVRSGWERWFAEVGLKPDDAYCIDRIANSGSYVPGNLRWATARVSARNSRGTKLSPVKVAEIRAIGRSLQCQAIADHHGVTEIVVCHILLGRTWPEIPAAQYIPAWAKLLISSGAPAGRQNRKRSAAAKLTHELPLATRNQLPSRAIGFARRRAS
jgi:hypothetical protein